MSKGTVRLPASAITGGMVGTARIREQISSAAARLNSTEPTPLDVTMRALAGAMRIPVEQIAADWQSTGNKSLYAAVLAEGMAKARWVDPVRTTGESPIERMQQLGRSRGGAMNKTEAAYAQLLDARRAAGAIVDFKFESVKLRLADRTWYMPDFCVFMHDGSVEMHEVKGFMTDDANVKLKVAAELYSQHIFRLVRKGKKGTWTITAISAR